MEFDVVIAGGGFAGAYCARALGKALGREAGEKRVALVAERNVLVFQPMLAEVAGSSLAAVDVVNPLRQFCRGVNVLQGTIQKIDWASKTLTIDGGRFTRDHRVGFGHLVVAMGSVTDLHAIPGMAEYGRPMRDVSDALRLRAAFINRLEEANLVEDPQTRSRLLTFVVIGGGYTGVEMAGQMLDFVRQAHTYYANLRGLGFRVVLVHSGAELLAEIGPELGAYARKILEKRGVEIRLKTRVTAVTASQVILDDGTRIEANTVVTTIGNAPNPVVMDLCAQLGIVAQRGRIPTDSAMRVAGHKDLWAAGDGASVPWNDKGQAKGVAADGAVRVPPGRAPRTQRLQRAERDGAPALPVPLHGPARVDRREAGGRRGARLPLQGVHRLVDVADDLPGQASRHRPQAARHDRLDLRLGIPARHQPDHAPAGRPRARDPPGGGRDTLHARYPVPRILLREARQR